MRGPFTRAATAASILALATACLGTQRSDAEKTPVPAVSSPSAQPSPAQQAGLSDGRNFGYIKAIDASSRTLVFDLAEFFTGEDADKAAAEDGQIQAGEHVDNDYYIRNKNTKLRTLDFSSSVRIRFVDWADCCELKDTELAPFADAFRPNGTTESYHGPNSQYWLTVRDGAVVEIEEQYLP